MLDEKVSLREAGLSDGDTVFLVQTPLLCVSDLSLLCILGSDPIDLMLRLLLSSRPRSMARHGFGGAGQLTVNGSKR